MNFKELKNLDHVEYGLLFDVRRSVRYHDKRAAFFEFVNVAIDIIVGFVFVFAILIMALFAFIPTSNEETTLACLGLAIAVSGEKFNALIAKWRHMHKKLQMRFSELELKIMQGPASGKCWTDYQAERLRIEMDEPRVFKILDTQCHNELLRVYGFEKSSNSYVHINWWQRLTCQLWPWSSAFTNICNP